MRGRNGCGALALCMTVLSWTGAAQAVVIAASTASGSPGQRVAIDVTLSAEGADVLATQNRIDFTRQVHVAAKGDGTPDCAVNPEIAKNATAFRFLPLGCDPAADCTAVRVFVLAFDNLLPIDDGSRLYTCSVAIAEGTAAGTYPLAIEEAGSSAAAGVVLPTTAADGAVEVTVPPVARVVIGSASGPPGDGVPLPVALEFLAPEAEIGGLSVDLAFDPATPVRASELGAPDCVAGGNRMLATGFLPAGCTPGDDCSGVRAIVTTVNPSTPLDNGDILFTCTIGIAASAAAGDYPVVAAAVAGSDLAGHAVNVTGVDGAITVGELPFPCAGDCDGSGEVSINELLVGVNIVIGAATVDQCTPVDTNGDGTVAINELIQAVNAALGGCPL